MTNLVVAGAHPVTGPKWDLSYGVDFGWSTGGRGIGSTIRRRRSGRFPSTSGRRSISRASRSNLT